MKKIFRNAIQEEKIQIIFVRAFPKVLQEGVKLNEKGGGVGPWRDEGLPQDQPLFQKF